MQIETTISTLYNVKKCLEEELNEFSINKDYTISQIRNLQVRKNHKKAAEMYNIIFNKLALIEDQIQSAIYKL